MKRRKAFEFYRGDETETETVGWVWVLGFKSVVRVLALQLVTHSHTMIFFF